jgi:hypothetical protein
MHPSITVAIPLHGSAPWIDNILANVRALPPMVTEVLLSDQTCIDDAASRLRHLLADDPRVSVRAAAAGLGFAEHYQMLLETAVGDLFMWMPHDDIFPADWVPTLCAALEANPKAWLAFGQLKCVEVAGVTPLWSLVIPEKPGLLPRTAAIRLMLSELLWSPFRGLFRREAVLAAQIHMDPDHSVISIDTEWVFTVALHGHLLYDDRTTTYKRLYEGSTHRTAQWKTQHRGSASQAALRLLVLHGPHGIAGLCLRMYVQCIVAEKKLRPTIRRARKLPGRIKRRVLRWHMA